MDIKNLETLIQLMKDNQLKVISIKDKDTEYHIEKESTVSAAPIQTTMHLQAAAPAEEPKGVGYIQTSVLVGTFYLTESETHTETMVKVGDHVEKGDRIGIVEAMKVMNDVTAEVSGTVEEIYVNNGAAVGFEEPLFRIKENG